MTASSVSKYPPFDISLGKDFVAIARGVYHSIVFVGEPVTLLLLSLVALVLWRCDLSTPWNRSASRKG